MSEQVDTVVIDVDIIRNINYSFIVGFLQKPGGIFYDLGSGMIQDLM